MGVFHPLVLFHPIVLSPSCTLGLFTLYFTHNYKWWGGASIHCSCTLWCSHLWWPETLHSFTLLYPFVLSPSCTLLPLVLFYPFALLVPDMAMSDTVLDRSVPNRSGSGYDTGYIGDKMLVPDTVADTLLLQFLSLLCSETFLHVTSTIMVPFSIYLHYWNPFSILYTTKTSELSSDIPLMVLSCSYIFMS